MDDLFEGRGGAHSPFLAITDALRAGDLVEDGHFDEVFPYAVRVASRIHWTPVAVALRAASFLAPDAASRVLDVGSGAGKFCVIGALATSGTFLGVEQRPHLVETARTAASRMGARRAAFVTAAMEDLPWAHFTGLYFYNPFGEHFLDPAERLDAMSHTSYRAYVHWVRVATAKLYLMPPGTRVATFHGIGAAMPPGYRFIERQQFSMGPLDFWIREDPATTSLDSPLSIFRQMNPEGSDVE